ncbi:MAG: autotransporter assembly complex protein TamA [Kiritimatiellia bacterium]
MAIGPAPKALQAADKPIRYRVRITGVEDRRLRREIRNVSVMHALSGRPPVSELQLQRRARRDPPLFTQILRNHGFYQAQVETRIDIARRRPRVRYKVLPGPVYQIRNVTLLSTDPSVQMPAAADIGLQSGQAALAARILAGDGEIVRILRTQGYALARVIAREVIVIHAEQALDVQFEIEPGSTYRFGETTFHGLQNVQAAAVRKKLPWAAGDPFDGHSLALARRRLIAADLFRAVRLVTEEERAGDLLPISVELSERKHRSVTLGFGYANDEGWRARAGWAHRNLLRNGERLSLDYGISEIAQGGELAFKRPDFGRVDQNVYLALQQELEDTLAYRSNKYGALVRIERLTNNTRMYGIGLGMRYSSVRDAKGRQAFQLLYIPITMEQDRSDNLLDPRSGTRLTLGVAPYWDTLDTQILFIKPRASLAVYHPLSRRKELDWAGRITLAAIVGQSRNNIPADERYYAGGGGSIRGYPFQSVGPLDRRTPTGGRSLFLFSQELRWRWSETMGMVAFIDGGAVTEEALFDPTGDDIRWGTGIGFRYFTPIGPLRIDAAVPIDRRKDIDDPWQFYISLGQAF